MITKNERPEGAREDDFSKLNDWTITDIANAPSTAREDHENAEAEIARRKEAGTYNIDGAPHETKKDFLGHGYGINEDGRILYPKPEYREWLESDRTGEAPRGIVRESINDRLESERATIEEEIARDERKQERDRAAGEIALQNFGDDTTREQIRRYSRMPRDRNELMQERRGRERASDIEFGARRKEKEFTKYGNSFSDPKKMQKAEMRENMPMFEKQESPMEKTDRHEPAEKRAEKLFNQYADGFSKSAPKWATVGVSSTLEKGILRTSNDSLIRSGFWVRESERIHERIDPNNTFTFEAVQAESDLKKRVVRDLIDERAKELSDVQVEKAKHDGIIYAIQSGAHIDERSGKVVYAINPDIKDAVLSTMENVKVDTADERIIRKSFQGFASIVEAIKDKPNETERGFEMLDWYFDNFRYAERLTEEDGFLDHLQGYESFADVSWSNKLNEYLNTRQEYRDYIKKQDSDEQRVKDIEAIERTEPIPADEYISQVADKLELPVDVLKDIAFAANYIFGKVLPPEPTLNTGPWTNIGGKYYYPDTFGKQKVLAVYAAWAVIRASGADPGAEVFQEGTPLMGEGAEKTTRKLLIGNDDYTVLRFGCANTDGIHENHALAESRSSTAASYTYVWHGDGDGWKKVLINNYKRVVKKIPGVGHKNHDHSRSPMSHIVELLYGMNIDLLALANQALINTQIVTRTGGSDEQVSNE